MEALPDNLPLDALGDDVFSSANSFAIDPALAQLEHAVDDPLSLMPHEQPFDMHHHPHQLHHPDSSQLGPYVREKIRASRQVSTCSPACPSRRLEGFPDVLYLPCFASSTATKILPSSTLNMVMVTSNPIRRSPIHTTIQIPSHSPVTTFPWIPRSTPTSQSAITSLTLDLNPVLSPRLWPQHP